MIENSHSHLAQRNSTKVHSPYFLNMTKKQYKSNVNLSEILSKRILISRKSSKHLGGLFL